MTNTSIELKFIDYYADVYNYNKPFKKYIFGISNGLYGESFITNHLNFNPAIIRTYTGIIFEKINENHSYFFHKNEKLTYFRGNTRIYVAFYFWMQNTMQYYVRKYESLIDGLSNVGGITRIILSVANVINYIVSRYIILVDSEELFFTQNEKNFKEELNNISLAERHIKKDIDNIGCQMNLHLNNNYNIRKNKSLSDNNYMNNENINCSKLSKEAFAIYGNRSNYGMIENLDRNKYLIYNKIMEEKNGIIKMKLKR